MKALVKREAAPGIWMEDVPPPELGANDVLIKITKAAICGTDIHIYQWNEWARRTIPVPMVIGHEFVGAISQLGAGVEGLAVGQRVSGEGHLVCGRCRHCRGGKRHLCAKTRGVGVNRAGCFADYLAIPASNVFEVPDRVGDNLAAIFDPFGNATHSALSFDLVGEDVLVTGAGPIGAMAAAIAVHVGARNVVVTDINDHRLGLAARMGVTCTINPNRESLDSVMADLGMTEGFDVGLEMSGSPAAFADMIAAMAHGGNVALLGLLPRKTSLDWEQVIFKSLTLKGVYGREMFETWYKMTAMLEGGLDISPLITHTFPAADYAEAFETMASGDSGKVILDWA